MVGKESDIPGKSKNKIKSISRLDQLEQIAKITATVLVPVVLAIGGWIIQTTIETDKQRATQILSDQQRAVDKERVSLEYVKIAKEVLTASDKALPKELTRWSWKLLNDVSPTKFDAEDLTRLIEGNERIPNKSVTRTFTADFELSESKGYYSMPFYKQDGEEGSLRCRLIYPSRHPVSIYVRFNDLQKGETFTPTTNRNELQFQLQLPKDNSKLFELNSTPFQQLLFLIDDSRPLPEASIIRGQCFLIIT